MPQLSEKILIAIQERRRLLTAVGVLGLKVVGPGKCRDTMQVREFLFKNFVPFTWYDSQSEQGKKLMVGWGSPKKSPVVECGGGELLINPGLRELAEGAGVWRHCPTGHGGPVRSSVGEPAGMTQRFTQPQKGFDNRLDRHRRDHPRTNFRSANAARRQWLRADSRWKADEIFDLEEPAACPPGPNRSSTIVENPF